MSTDLSVIAVSWNTASDLEKALDSLPSAVHPRSFETIVIDNGSEDGSLAMLRARTDIQLVELGTNTGFTRAANVGAARAQGEHLLFLNPDIVAPPGSLATLLAGLEADPAAYGATPWFRNPDGTPQYFWRRAPSVTIIAFCFTRLGKKIDALFGRRVHRHRVYGHLPDPPGRLLIHGVGAACLMLRREEFIQAGAFDERYMNFFQDAHLMRHFAREGRPFIGDGTVEVFHVGGVSLRHLGPSEVEGQFFHALRQYLVHEPMWRRVAGELLIRLELIMPGGDRDALRARRVAALRPLDLPKSTQLGGGSP